MAKYWRFSISPSNGYSELIYSRIDWFYFLAVQGTFKSLLQYHSSKASILQFSAFFMVQISHPHMTTGKTISLTIKTFVSKVMPQLLVHCLNFFIAFLPRSKWFFFCLFVCFCVFFFSWLHHSLQHFWSPSK